MFCDWIDADWQRGLSILQFDMPPFLMLYFYPGFPSQILSVLQLLVWIFNLLEIQFEGETRLHLWRIHKKTANLGGLLASSKSC